MKQLWWLTPQGTRANPKRRVEHLVSLVGQGKVSPMVVRTRRKKTWRILKMSLARRIAGLRNSVLPYHRRKEANCHMALSELLLPPPHPFPWPTLLRQTTDEPGGGFESRRHPRRSESFAS